MPDLSVSEVATIVGRCTRTVRRRYKQGRFPNAYRDGREIRIPPEDVEKFRTPTQELRPEDKALLDELLGDEV